LKNVSDGDCVRIHDGNKWQPGKIVENKQLRSFNVKTLNGNIVRRNRKHILKTKEEVDWDVNLSDNESDMNDSKDIVMGKRKLSNNINIDQNTNQDESVDHDIIVTRSGRVSRKPKHYTDYEMHF
jgi:hypothetical protein